MFFSSTLLVLLLQVSANIEFSPLATSAQGQECNKATYDRWYPCGPGLEHLAKFDTCILVVVHPPMSAHASLQRCKDRNLDSVYIPTGEFDNALSDLGAMENHTYTWIGLLIEQDTLEWKWSQGHSLKYSNWVGQTAATPDKCVAKQDKASGGQWVGRDCGEELPFICQRLVGKGKVEVSLRPHARVFYVGEPLEATCTATGESGPRMFFTISGTDGPGNFYRTFDSAKHSNIHIQDVEYKIVKGKCIKVRAGTLKVETSFFMLSKHLVCCAFTADGESLCSTDIVRLSIISVPQRPDLVVRRNKPGRLVARCDAVVRSGGSLMWALASDSHAWLWETSLHLGKYKIGPDLADVEIEDAETSSNDSRGFTMSQKLVLRLGRKYERHTLACLSYPNQSIESSSDLWAGTDPLMSKPYAVMDFRPQKPNLSVAKTMRRDTKWATFVCRAYVGVAGALTWRLDLDDLDDWLWSIASNGSVAGDVSSDVTLANVTVTFDLEKGSYITSAVKMNVSNVFVRYQVVNVSCFSHLLSNSSPQGWRTLGKVISLQRPESHDVKPYFYVSNDSILRILLYTVPPICLLVLILGCLSTPINRRYLSPEDEGEEYTDTDSESETSETLTFEISEDKKWDTTWGDLSYIWPFQRSSMRSSSVDPFLKETPV